MVASVSMGTSLVPGLKLVVSLWGLGPPTFGPLTLFAVSAWSLCAMSYKSSYGGSLGGMMFGGSLGGV